MSAPNKRINKKTATKVPVSSSSSQTQFPRIVGPAGVISPAQPTTIPQAFQEQQALITHTKEWHAETRQKIIETISQLPGAAGSHWFNIQQAYQPSFAFLHHRQPYWNFWND